MFIRPVDTVSISGANVDVLHSAQHSFLSFHLYYYCKMFRPVLFMYICALWYWLCADMMLGWRH